MSQSCPGHEAQMGPGVARREALAPSAGSFLHSRAARLSELQDIC